MSQHTPPIDIRRHLQKTQFFTSANELSQLPKSQAEIAFAGRSNAGKSSALNRITGIRNLARTSKTPGRTQLINYFEIEPELFLVDLPGYGYAKVPERIKLHWQSVLQAYFEEREALNQLIMVMDVRRPLTELDTQMLHWCEASDLPTHILLTKADKLTRNHGNQALMKVQKEIAGYDNLVTAQLFSATKPEIGLAQLHELIGEWLTFHLFPELDDLIDEEL